MTQESFEPVRYAVVGMGHIAQAAILPAFRRAEHSVLAAIVSSDRQKRKKLARKYKIPAVGYEEYDALVGSGNIDAVYIALPNNMHCDYSVRAANAGVHVLCEKPMAVTGEECHRMIEDANSNGVRLMIAYRLHFEEANLTVREAARAGRLGSLKYFSSNFSMQVRPENIRLQRELGGGTLYDIGIYCINAARTLFSAEPIEVIALTGCSGDSRFDEVEEIASAVLRFPGDRIASFTSSFGSSDASSYELIGTEGSLKLDPAYEYAGKLSLQVTLDGRTRRRTFSKRDQFAAELTYFSRCVRQGNDPEPSGLEGLADVRVIEALYQSANTGQAVKLPELHKAERPNMEQEIHHPPHAEPELVRVESPSE